MCACIQLVALTWLALLASAPGEMAHQAPAQLRLQATGCPPGYVHLIGGQCSRRSEASQLRRDHRYLEPRFTEFRPVRRRGPWSEVRPASSSGSEVRSVSSSGSEVLPVSSSGSEVRPVSSSGSEVRSVSSSGSEVRPVSSSGSEVRPVSSSGSEVRPVSSSGSEVRPASAYGSERQQQADRVKAMRRPAAAAYHSTGRGAQRPLRVTGGDRSAAAPLTAIESRPWTPTCRSGQPDRSGRCQDGPGPAAGRSGRNRVLDRGQRPAQPKLCPQGFVRLSKGQCIPDTGYSSETPATAVSAPADSAHSAPTQATDSAAGDGRGESAAGENRSAKRRPARRREGRRRCAPGQVRWRRGRCVSADRLRPCPAGSRRRPTGRCVRCGVLPPLDDGRCPAGCAQTAPDSCTCCQPNRRHHSANGERADRRAALDTGRSQPDLST